MARKTNQQLAEELEETRDRYLAVCQEKERLKHQVEDLTKARKKLKSELAKEKIARARLHGFVERTLQFEKAEMLERNPGLMQEKAVDVKGINLGMFESMYVPPASEQNEYRDVFGQVPYTGRTESGEPWWEL